MAVAPDALQHALYIPQVVKQIGTDHKIELFLQVERMCIGLNVSNFRMTFLRPFYHQRRQVDSNAIGRSHRCKQVALAAAHFQHPHSGRDEEAIDLRQALSIIVPDGWIAIQLLRGLVPVLLTIPGELRLFQRTAVLRGNGGGLHECLIGKFQP